MFANFAPRPTFQVKGHDPCRGWAASGHNLVKEDSRLLSTLFTESGLTPSSFLKRFFKDDMFLSGPLDLANECAEQIRPNIADGGRSSLAFFRYYGGNRRRCLFQTRRRDSRIGD